MAWVAAWTVGEAPGGRARRTPGVRTKKRIAVVRRYIMPIVFVLVCENLLKLHQARSIRTIVPGTTLDFYGRRLLEIPRREGTVFKSLLGEYRRRTPLGAWGALVGARQTSHPGTIGLCVETHPTCSSSSMRRHHENDQQQHNESDRSPLRKLEFHLF